MAKSAVQRSSDLARARTWDAWNMDSGFIGSVLDSSARLVHTLKTDSCNTLFTLDLKSFYRLDFFSDSGSVSQRFD